MPGLFFCRDGILRVREWHSEFRVRVALPLRSIEAVHRNAFLKQLTFVVELEPGLTVGELFENLAPWSDLMEGIACMDFQAFLEETRLPPAPDPDFDRVEISYFLAIQPKAAFDNPSSRRLFLGKPRVTDRIALEGAWHHTGYLKTPRIDGAGTSWECAIEHSSVDYAPLNHWAHLPIVINRKAEFRDQTPRSDHLAYKGPLFDRANPGVKSVGSRTNLADGSDDGSWLETPIEAPTPTFMEAIVRGFFFGIGHSYSPPGRDDLVDLLHERMAGVPDAGDDAGSGEAEIVSGAFERMLFGSEEEDVLEAARLDAEFGPLPEKDDEGTRKRDSDLDELIAVCLRADPAGGASVRGLTPDQASELLDRSAE